MVKVVKIAAYQIGERVVTSVAEAEKITREEVIKEILDAEMSFSGIVCPEDVAHTLSENWDKLNRLMTEALRGI